MRFLFKMLVGFLVRLALPTVNSDTDIWGTELNNFLLVAHDVNGNILPKALGLITFNSMSTTSYTIAASDAGVVVNPSNASPVTVTVPTDAAMVGGAMAFGQSLMVRQAGAGQVNIVAASGVVVNSRGGLTHLAGQYAYAQLIKAGTNNWDLAGDLA